MSKTQAVVAFVGSLIAVVAFWGFLIGSAIRGDSPGMHYVSIVEPYERILTHLYGQGPGCRVDMNARFDPLTFQGKAISRYHRLGSWGLFGWEQCREGELVEVNPAMLASWHAERDERQQRQAAYEALRTQERDGGKRAD